jgi:hypothetical protein
MNTPAMLARSLCLMLAACGAVQAESALGQLRAAAHDRVPLKGKGVVSGGVVAGGGGIKTIEVSGKVTLTGSGRTDIVAVSGLIDVAVVTSGKVAAARGCGKVKGLVGDSDELGNATGAEGSVCVSGTGIKWGGNWTFRVEGLTEVEATVERSRTPEGKGRGL